MIKDFITNLTILHKNHMVKIGNRTLAGAVSNGAHMVVCHAVRDIVTIFPRSFYYYSTDIHIPAGFGKIQRPPRLLYFFSTVIQY